MADDVKRDDALEAVETSDPAAAAASVYASAGALLRSRGWCRGREVEPSGALSLTAAIEMALRERAPHGDTARLARIRTHLREIADTGNLHAWHDSTSRTFPEVLNLLQMASTLYPND